ncbi:MAG: hypothetical protein Q7S87_01135 [Agitococcus sp.]|nr:hypothetical protein [Agitococcus sp.]MDO9179131.1 hypothetical protein [Agitococcus sp.]
MTKQKHREFLPLVVGLMNRHNHRELLPMVVGQGIAMCLLAGMVMLVGAVGWGILESCFHTLQVKGVDAFLPSNALWRVVLQLGLGVAFFNIACDSVEIDISQHRRNNSVITYCAIVLSAAGISMGISDLVSLVLAFQIEQLKFATHFLTGVLFMCLGLFLLRKHRNNLMADSHEVSALGV